MFFVVIYELITKHHLPASRGSMDDGFVNYPTAFFYNPNDFATVIALFFPILYYLCKILNKMKQLKIISILSLFFIVVSLSRVALMIFLVTPLLIYFINNKFTKLVGTTLLFFSIVILLTCYDFKFYNNDTTLVNRNANKLLTIIKDPQINKSGGLIKNVRFGVYKEVIVNPEKFILGGGFIASEILYKKGLIPLMNPHSFWAEGIIDFGYLGFLPILILILFPLYLSIRNFNKDLLFKCLLIQILYFIVLLNVPSGVMCLPIIWVPIAIFYAFLFNYHDLRDYLNNQLNA